MVGFLFRRLLQVSLEVYKEIRVQDSVSVFFNRSWYPWTIAKACILNCEKNLKVVEACFGDSVHPTFVKNFFTEKL